MTSFAIVTDRTSFLNFGRACPYAGARRDHGLDVGHCVSDDGMPLRLGGADGGVIPLHGIDPQNQGPLRRNPAFPRMSQEDQRAKLIFLAHRRIATPCNRWICVRATCANMRGLRATRT
jgi:hypothetical protein